MKKIAIVGCGFVGGAVAQGMNHAFDVLGYDSKKSPNRLIHWPKSCSPDTTWTVETDGLHPIEYFVNEVDGPIFVCVPTPMKSDGSCDTSIVSSVVKQIDSFCSQDNKKVVVIKSTVPPGTTANLNKECKNSHICFNPEFLREATAIEDFKNQDRIIIGGPHAGTKIVKQIYQMAYPDVPTTKTDSTIAELVKYVTNCFLATKVSFANEIYQICQALDIDYDKVIEYATKDKRLGTSHWAVPGPMPADDGTGRTLPGYSGSCIVKDINALIFLSKQIGVQPTMMEASWEKNKIVRPERDWENLIGRAISENS